MSDAAHLPGLGPDDELVRALPEVQPFVVEVTRSKKRRKTVGAQLGRRCAAHRLAVVDEQGRGGALGS